VTNEYGDSVVVRARKTDTQQKGEVFIPRGIWANTVVRPRPRAREAPATRTCP